MSVEVVLAREPALVEAALFERAKVLFRWSPWFEIVGGRKMLDSGSRSPLMVLSMAAGAVMSPSILAVGESNVAYRAVVWTLGVSSAIKSVWC